MPQVSLQQSSQTYNHEEPSFIINFRVPVSRVLARCGSDSCADLGDDPPHDGLAIAARLEAP